MLSGLGELSDEQCSIFEMATDFAAQELTPHALEWDQTKHFPVDVLRKAATLGMDGIYISDDVGGSGLARMDAVLIFEALSQGCPVIATELEVARVFLRRAARALDRRDANAVKLCAMAKCFVTDAGFNVANQALQLHGGYGYLSEYGIEKLVRDLRVHQILEGTNEIMRVIIARELLHGREL